MAPISPRDLPRIVPAKALQAFTVKTLAQAFDRIVEHEPGLGTKKNRLILTLPEVLSSLGQNIAARIFQHWLFGRTQAPVAYGKAESGEFVEISGMPAAKTQPRHWRRVTLTGPSRHTNYVLPAAFFTANPSWKSDFQYFAGRIRHDLEQIAAGTPADAPSLLDEARRALVANLRGLRDGDSIEFPVFTGRRDVDGWVSHTAMSSAEYVLWRELHRKSPTFDDALAAVGSVIFRGIPSGKAKRIKNGTEDSAIVEVAQHIVRVCDGFDFQGEQPLGVWDLVKGVDFGRTVLQSLLGGLAAPRDDATEIGLTNASMRAFAALKDHINEIAQAKLRLRIPPLKCEEFWVVSEIRQVVEPYEVRFNFTA